MSSPAGFPPDQYLQTSFSLPERKGPRSTRASPQPPSLRVEQQNSHLRSVGTRWGATVAVFEDHPLDMVGEQRTQEPLRQHKT